MTDSDWRNTPPNLTEVEGFPSSEVLYVMHVMTCFEEQATGTTYHISLFFCPKTSETGATFRGNPRVRKPRRALRPPLRSLVVLLCTPPPYLFLPADTEQDFRRSSRGAKLNLSQCYTARRQTRGRHSRSGRAQQVCELQRRMDCCTKFWRNDDLTTSILHLPAGIEYLTALHGDSIVDVAVSG